VSEQVVHLVSPTSLKETKKCTRRVTSASADVVLHALNSFAFDALCTI
jgi:hypothetical protein